MFSQKKNVIRAVAAIMVLASTQGHATPESWVGTGSDTNMTTPGNWTGTTVPTGDTATFGTASVPGAPNYLPVLTSGNSLTISNANFTANNALVTTSSSTSGGLTITGGVTASGATAGFNISGGTLTFSGATSAGSSGNVGYSLTNGTLILSAGQTSSGVVDVALLNGTASGLTTTASSTVNLDSLSSANTDDTITLGTGSTLSIHGSGDQTIAGTISGTTGTFIQGGTGTTTLTHSNTFGQAGNGGTQITAGTLSISSDTNLGAAAATLTLNGGTVQWSATDTTSTRPITLGANDGTVDTQTFDVTLGGAITGSASGDLTKLGSGTLVLDGSQSAFTTGSITVTDGVLQIQGLSTSVPNVAIHNNGDGVTFNQGTSTYTGNMDGTGTLTLNGSGNTYTLTGTNTQEGGTVVTNLATASISTNTQLGASLALNNGTLVTTAAIAVTSPIALTGSASTNTIDTGTFTDVFSGAITGAGGGFTKTGTGTLVLSGTANTYDTGTNIAAGILQAGSQNLPAAGPILVEANGTLNFTQVSDGTFTGIISGSGNVTTVGSTSELTLTANSSAFTGTTAIPGGELHLNSGSFLGGVVNVNGGTLSGVGTVGSPSTTVTVSAGTIHPGNSPGIMSVAGNYAQTGGTFLVDVLGTGNVPEVNNSELVVTGTATLTNSPIVQVISDDGSFNISGKDTILTSAGLTGTFSDSVVTLNALTGNPLFVTPILTYDADNVYLDFQTPFIGLAENDNEANVAIQLTTIAIPDPDEAILLSNITALSTDDILVALDNLSGSEYAQLLSATALSNHQFLRRLYDPLRAFLNGESTPYGCEYGEVEVWLEGSGGRSFFKNSSQALGFSSSGYEITLGAQTQFDDSWTAGAALCYENKHYHFNTGSSGESYTALGALYGAYRSCGYYVVGDLVLGGSWDKIKRSFVVGPVLYDEIGKPDNFQGTLYAEAGIDYNCSCLLVQPFIGLEGDYYNFGSFNESGSDPVQLNFNDRSYGAFDTRLGVHLSSSESFYGIDLALDLAWQYRWTSLDNFRTTEFADFGSDFKVQGSDLDRSSFDGGINISKEVCDTWTLYFTANGQFWGNATSYDLVGGMSVDW